MENVCFVCETPFQVLNCINYCYNNKNKATFDVYISDAFYNSTDIALKIKSIDLFKNVICYHSYSDDQITNRYFNKYGYVATPHRYIINVTERDYHYADYDAVFVSTLTKMGMAMIMQNPKADICYYDDGLSSYFGKIGEKSITKKRRIVYRLRNMDYKHLQPSCMFVNNVSMCHSEWCVPIYSLPSIDKDNKELWNILKIVFDTNSKNHYSDYKIVYLSQAVTPLDRIAYLKQLTNNSIISGKIIFRPHPRHHQVFDWIECDDTGNMWELVAAGEIQDNHILLSECSTAQFVPKLLFDKEPYIIFMFDMFSDYSKDEITLHNQTFSELVRNYKKPDKVIRVANYENLVNTLERIINEK